MTDIEIARQSTKELLASLIDTDDVKFSEIIKTEEGKEWFYDEVKRANIKENIAAQKVLAGLANYNFIETKV